MKASMTACLAAAVLALVPAIAEAELVERGDLFVRFDGGIAPDVLPRNRLAPIEVRVDGVVRTLSGERPPALRQIKVELNSGGVVDPTGLPICRFGHLDGASPGVAMQECGESLVGTGTFAAKAAFPEQATFPTSGHILAFSGVYRGREAILAHTFGTDPLPITRIVVFYVRRKAGTFGTVLIGSLPVNVNRYGYLTKISLRLQRRFRYRGKPRSYISASCPAPVGFFRAVFPFARTSMEFENGGKLSSTLTRSCHVRR